MRRVGQSGRGTGRRADAAVAGRALPLVMNAVVGERLGDVDAAHALLAVEVGQRARTLTVLGLQRPVPQVKHLVEAVEYLLVVGDG